MGKAVRQGPIYEYQTSYHSMYIIYIGENLYTLQYQKSSISFVYIIYIYIYQYNCNLMYTYTYMIIMSDIYVYRANMSKHQNVLSMSVNADTKFQAHICPFNRVTTLNVHEILVYQFNIW